MNKNLLYIVDDDPMHSQMMHDHIQKKHNFQIKTFSTGEDAVEAMNGIQPGIVVLDYHLDSVKAGARNGVEILQFLKKNYPDTDVIMFSGQDKIDVAVDSMQYGAIDYVVKNESAFVRTEHAIQRIADKYRLQSQVVHYRKLNAILIVGFLAIIGLTIGLSVGGVI